MCHDGSGPNELSGSEFWSGYYREGVWHPFHSRILVFLYNAHENINNNLGESVRTIGLLAKLYAEYIKTTQV